MVFFFEVINQLHFKHFWRFLDFCKVMPRLWSLLTESRVRGNKGFHTSKLCLAGLRKHYKYPRRPPTCFSLHFLEENKHENAFIFTFGLGQRFSFKEESGILRNEI